MRGALAGAVPGAADGQPFDLGVVVSFKYFLPARVIRGVRLGVINMHPSLLPAYRGMADRWASVVEGGDVALCVDLEKFRR